LDVPHLEPRSIIPESTCLASSATASTSRVLIAPLNLYALSFAIRIASSAVAKGITQTAGPNISHPCEEVVKIVRNTASPFPECPHFA